MHPFRPNRVLALALGALTAIGAAPAARETKLLRFPDIHGEHIVLSYAGDLWRAPSAGGTAAG